MASQEAIRLNLYINNEGRPHTLPVIVDKEDVTYAK